MTVAATFPEQLRDQAGHLASKDRRKPSQANLRRAISAAYYALFHRLVDDSSISLVGGGQESAALRDLLRRTFAHADMQKASKSFASDWGGLPPTVQACVPGPNLPPGLIRVAQAFVDLQEARHEADYDLSQRFMRQEVLDLLKQTDEAFASWFRVRKNPAARTYLLCLLQWTRLHRQA